MTSTSNSARLTKYLAHNEDPKRVTVRTLLGWFGQSRRGAEVVERVREAHLKCTTSKQSLTSRAARLTRLSLSFARKGPWSWIP